jgi:phosphoribosylformylglycinamidine synthase
VASGKILANELRHALREQFQKFVNDGNLIIGICNGFQVLVKMGLLPGRDLKNGQTHATLTFNDSNKFEARWITLMPQGDTCVFMKKGDAIDLPVAHGEGKLMFSSSEELEKIIKHNQVVFRYIAPDGTKPVKYPFNPNGSTDDIAGICDATGRILGMMPHPERFVHYYQHPQWTRRDDRGEGDGLAIFRNAVEFVKGN